ncbi:MAG TPA: MEDS domain-containing protein [Thermomonospora sp.]|nr:MEDS domain-containing protein [Thermomonospora sp.]
MESPWSVRRPVGELRPGDHAWLAFGGAEERSHVLGAFVRQGLAGEDRIIVVGGADCAEPPFAGDRVTVLSLDGPDAAALEPGRLTAALRAEIRAAVEAGYRGVRVVADLTWTLGRPGGLDLMLACERQIEQAVAPSTAATAVCQIDRACGAAVLDALADAHAVTVTPDPHFEDAVLRIERTFHPVGLAVGGQLDASRHAVFSEALSTTMACADGDPVHVDLAGLEFIDLGALTMLAEAAARRRGRGPLVIDRIPERLRAIIEVVGWDTLPGLRLGSPRDDR